MLPIMESSINEAIVIPTAEVMMPAMALPLPPNSLDSFNPVIDKISPIMPGTAPKTGI